MKLPLMAALTALLLGGCAHEGASHASKEASGTGGSGSEAQRMEPAVGASDELSWDAEASPRTQAMLRDHGMNFYGDSDSEVAVGGSGSSGQTQASSDEYECVDADPVGTGGSGESATDPVGATPLIPLVAPQNPGARFDITPDAWKKNKAIGTSPVSPSTGTPAVEGSGGASGR
ncbi:hypothetical protein D7X74_06760 [Corallococcus sp. CA047B]|uniref:hypothetical protein n=1 Tax=Corallococcus sp. CA047B TaxID=2316729 RepID=UPI000EA1C536|nr:hypothetical protein [Corallococcus sp. CA047B]RKH19424.1 hypothetical protein D7X74_06760 [Corallococcus sp. CA047B]